MHQYVCGSFLKEDSHMEYLVKVKTKPVLIDHWAFKLSDQIRNTDGILWNEILPNSASKSPYKHLYGDFQAEFGKISSHEILSVFQIWSDNLHLLIQHTLTKIDHGKSGKKRSCREQHATMKSWQSYGIMFECCVC